MMSFSFRRSSRHLAALPLILAVALPVPAALARNAPTPGAAAQVANPASLESPIPFEQARQAILSMAGNYRVRFDMQEATPWVADYTPIDHEVSGGHEVVRVIEDSGTRIALQHLLVVEHGGQVHIIKHWRQDWEYEPARLLVYTDSDSWAYRPVSAEERRGKWSQTVYQVDDSPRYGGIGAWVSVGGVPTWVSGPTWRPLARRDAVRGPVYDRYYGVNRHQLTPTGWIHWQDNMKVAETDGRFVPIVQEYVLNSYTRFDAYNVAAADAYWAATRGYWAAVRAEWNRIAETKGGIHIMEVAATGSATSVRLLEIADALQKGEATEAQAIEQARALMEQGTSAL